MNRPRLRPEHELLLLQMETALTTLVDQTEAGGERGSGGPEAVARALLGEAERRAQVFSEVEHHDPQWLMLLDLFVAREQGAEICVSSLCIASRVPPTTALRHITALEKRGLVQRTGHPRDARRSIIALTDEAAERMVAYLAWLERGPRGRQGAPATRPH